MANEMKVHSELRVDRFCSIVKDSYWIVFTFWQS